MTDIDYSRQEIKPTPHNSDPSYEKEIRMNVQFD